MKRLLAIIGVLLVIIVAISLLTFTFFNANASVQPQQTSTPIHYMSKPASPRSFNSVAAASTQNLAYSGGPIMTGTAVNYAIYWGSDYPAASKAVVNSYFQKVGGTPFYNI